MKRKTLIFLKPFTIENPTLDQQTAFLIRENVNEIECACIGKVYTNDDLHGKDIYRFISNEIKTHNPEWIVAEGECATVALKIRHHKKILLNPGVSTDVLNNVSEFFRQYTYGFFDNKHERDYELFLTAYPHAACFTQDSSLTLFTIKEIIQEIIETK